MIEDEVRTQLGILETQIKGASFLRGQIPVNPRDTFGRFEFKDQDTLYVRSKLNGGSQRLPSFMQDKPVRDHNQEGHFGKLLSLGDCGNMFEPIYENSIFA